jgi:hypothetical protein
MAASTVIPFTQNYFDKVLEMLSVSVTVPSTEKSKL